MQYTLCSIRDCTLCAGDEKIEGAIDRNELVDFGKIHIGLVAGVIKAFKDRLEERGIFSAYDSITYLVELIEYPIQELTVYFADATSSTLNAKGANIFAFFIYKQIEELKCMAKEIDEDYNSKP